ncbi:MAG: lactate dehydrogenase [Clostridiales bacterium]|jgi:hypothetical protein|nr:lactate dehydrogenase [Clostridiales bacterium]
MPPTLQKKEGYRIHIAALGDVGATLLLGLKLLGGPLVAGIGIFDVRKEYMLRYEREMNQIALPPQVYRLDEGALFDCDAFVFCASAHVPGVGTDIEDVRMAQLEGNANILAPYADSAAKSAFGGLFTVVSDPVDLLCQCARHAAEKAARACGGRGLAPAQIRGYGLGVMHARALYYATRDSRFHMYADEGRAFGPHGRGLIIANSITAYDDALSRELTQLTLQANLDMRALGFKPYIAPAISSAAIPLLQTLAGEWHYSAIYRDGIYFGCKNRLAAGDVEVETLTLPDPLQRRIDETRRQLQKEDARWI